MSVLSPVCFLSNSAWKEKALNIDTLLNVNSSVVNSGGLRPFTVETVATPFEKSVLPDDVAVTRIDAYPATCPVVVLQSLQPASKFKRGAVMAGSCSTKVAWAGLNETAARNAAASIPRDLIIFILLPVLEFAINFGWLDVPTFPGTYHLLK